MNYVIASVTKQSIFLTFSILLALLAACGDESSSSAPDPISEISSSSNEELGSSSSVAEKNSSSSVKSGDDSQKSSSSVNYKNSSSSEDESSSSEGCPFNGRNEDGSANLTVNCCNGDTAIVIEGGFTVYYSCRDNFWFMDSVPELDTIKPYVPHPNMEKQFASNVDYETFVDERDGQEYKVVTITIDNGLAKTRTFFAENLNYGKQMIRQVFFCKFMHKKQIFPFPSRLSKLFLPSIPRVVPSVASR